MPPPVTLTTEAEHVHLRQLTLADAPTLFDVIEANRRSGHLRELVGNDAALADVGAVAILIEVAKTFDSLLMGIYAEETLVGCISLDRDFIYPSTAEVGYWLDGNQTGKGYATFATRALTQYAAQRALCLQAFVKPHNTKSMQVLERAGFRPSAFQDSDDRILFVH